MSLLVVGTVAFDTIETPFGKAEMVLGGSGSYIGWSASYFQRNINLVSIVGDDMPAEELEQMQARGIDLEGLEIVEGKKSFFWAGRYHNNMNSRDTLVTDLNVLADFDPILPEKYKASEYIFLGNLTPAIQSSVIDQVEAAKFVAMDTMNFWMDVAWDELMATIKKIDCIIINDEEARQLSKEYSLLDAAKKIQTMGPKYVVIKKGEHGALLFGEGENMFYAPAMPLATVKDPTGAGDTFAGGFMGYLSKCDEVTFESMKTALICGSAMASFCVEEFSLDKLKEIHQEELNLRLQSFKQLVDFKL